VVVGILFLDEALEPSQLYALAPILGGLLASRAGPGRSRPTPADWTSARSPSA
jgi:hypothetical protein